MAALRDSPIASPGVPAELQTPLTRAETLAIAGEQARDAGQREAAIDAWLAEAREGAAAHKFDAALDAALRALALDTGATRVHLALTRLYFERGWDRDARQRAAALRRLLELAPDSAISAGLDELEREFSAGAAER
jgi:hypothetical protein